MGYFDGLTDALFKRTSDGGVAFYPWGAIGNGYVVTEPEKVRELRTFVRNYYRLTLPLFILIGVLLRGRALWSSRPCC